MLTESKANVRVLVRVRPLNEREKRFNPKSILDIDERGMKSSISFDFGLSDDENSNDDGSRGTISILDQPSAAASSGYDSGTNNKSKMSKQFTYDAVFGPESTQPQIYSSISGIVDSVCAGYNGCVLAYGQTVS